MPEVKTTILVDEESWASFREYVMSRYGSSRKLSAGVGEALRAFDCLGLLTELADRLRIGPRRYPSSDEIRSKRPKTTISAGRVVREMRNARQTRVSGHK